MGLQIPYRVHPEVPEEGDFPQRIVNPGPSVDTAHESVAFASSRIVEALPGFVFSDAFQFEFFRKPHRKETLQLEVQLLSLISKTWIFILKWIEKIATLQKRDDQILEGWQNNPCNNLCGHGGMVDAIDLGSIGTPMQVQVLLPAPS